MSVKQLTVPSKASTLPGVQKRRSSIVNEPSPPQPLAAPPVASGEQRRGIPWRSALLVVGTIALTVALAFLPVDAVSRLGSYGYLGVFLLVLLSSATIVLPSPAVGVALAAGKAGLNPWAVGGLSGIAAGLGEITGYLAGLGGNALAERSRFYPRVERWVREWGLLTIFVLAVIPSPIFDLAGIAAGAMRVPFLRFLIACMLGKTVRFVMLAWIGRLLL